MTESPEADRVDILTALDAFVCDHQPHGELTGDATEPSESGYMITVTCLCASCSSGG